MAPDSSANPLPGVPLIDSPFFERVFALSNPDSETQRIAHDLRENGFAVFDFPDTDIDRLCREVRTRHAPAEEKLEAWRAGRIDLRNQDAWRIDANVKRIATNSRRGLACH